MTFLLTRQTVIRAAAAIPTYAALQLPRQTYIALGHGATHELVDLGAFSVGVTVPDVPLAWSGNGSRLTDVEIDGETDFLNDRILFGYGDPGQTQPVRRVGLRGQARGRDDQDH